MRIGLTEITGCRKSTGCATAEARLEGAAVTAFPLRFFIAHLVQDRGVVPEIIKIIGQNIADDQRNKTAGRDISIGPQMQGK